MNPNRPKVLTVVSVGLLALLTLCARARSQEAPVASDYTHYRLVFLPGTFGGADNHFLVGGTHILNNEGSFVGWSDTPLPDPFPNNCWDAGECIVAGAFEFRNGRMTDLGGLAPGFSSDTNWISPSGLISGEAQTGQAADESIGGWTMHGILWARGNMIDLGTLDGGPISLTTGVNDAAEVSGFALNTIPDPFSMFGGNQTRAYRWKNGVMKDLGTLGGPDAMALRINQRGQIAGNSYISLDPSDFCVLRTGGFIWENGNMSDLGGLGGTCTMVSDMNDRGQVVGGSLLAADQAQHPFLWERGKLTDLGTLGGNIATGVAINEGGDVVGFATLRPNDLIFHATLWSKGRILDLGALAPGGCSLATSVNSQLQVVGLNSSTCDLGDDPSFRAVISEHGGPMVDLNTLIPVNSGVELRNAPIINNRGQIVAVAFFPDGNHAPVLLVPCEGKSDQAESCQNSGTASLGIQETPTRLLVQTKASQLANEATSMEKKRLFGPMGRPNMPAK